MLLLQLESPPFTIDKLDTKVLGKEEEWLSKYSINSNFCSNNGNATLFMLTFFTCLVPNYKIYQGAHMATTVYFYFITVAYCLMYFTEMRNIR